MTDSVVAVFADHQAAEAAIRELTGAGFEMKHLSVVGKGYHTEEKVVGFYSAGEAPDGLKPAPDSSFPGRVRIRRA